MILWDLADRARPRRLGSPLAHPGEVHNVAFAPGGRTLATSGATLLEGDTKVILWDLTDRARPRPLGSPLAHPGGVASMAFSPDGHTLATGGGVSVGVPRVILWDLAERARPRPLGLPVEHPGGVASIVFAPDARTLATTNATGVRSRVILWELADLNTLYSPVERACSLTGGGLNRKEWDRYIRDLPYRNTCSKLN